MFVEKKVNNLAKDKKFYKELCSDRRQLYKRYKRSAEIRGKSFDLSPQIFTHLTNCKCFYCGKTPYQKQGKIKYNGIDRIENEKGYIVGNVVSCCGKCNKAKGTMSFHEFNQWIHEVSQEYNEKLQRVEKHDVEYFATRGVLMSDRTPKLDLKKLKTIWKIDHGKVSRKYFDFLSTTLKTTVKTKNKLF